MAVGQTAPPAGMDEPLVRREWTRDVGPRWATWVLRWMLEKAAVGVATAANPSVSVEKSCMI